MTDDAHDVDRGDRGTRAADDERDLEVVLIAAVAANGVIGRDGEIPWDLPADMRHFRRTTTGHPVVMGRRTFESITRALGEPLPERTNVVLTTRGSLDYPGDGAVVVVDGVEAALDTAAARDEVVYVAGGAEVYEQFLPRADRLLVTELEDAHEGDAHFSFDRARWRERSREERDGFAFVTYERTE